MDMTEQTVPKDYSVATQAVACYSIPDAGYLLLSGETRREYVQRQTTNDIDLLTTTRTLPDLLTSPNGRILEFFTLLDLGDSIAILTQPGHGPGLAAYFQKRIFFNDKVAVQDQSTKWLQFEIHGPKAPVLLARFDFPTAPDLDKVLDAEWQGARIRALGQLGFGANPRLVLIIPASHSAHVAARLSDIPTLSSGTREILRIESGHAGGPEFAARATPFELGLDRLISTTKGCYTGQEVLARQVTYDKVVRRLVRLHAEKPLETGSTVLADSKAVGQITSSAISPRLGPMALGVVRKPYDAENAELLVQHEGKQVTVTVMPSQTP